MTNLNLAFEVAEKELDIPKMLDAEGKYSNHIPFSIHFQLMRGLTGHVSLTCHASLMPKKIWTNSHSPQDLPLAWVVADVKILA